VGWAVVAALGLFLVTSIDLVTRQERLVNLNIFRYDRPWPYGPPWNLDFSSELFGFAALFGLGLCALLRPSWRRKAIVCRCVVGAGFALFTVAVLLPAGAQHWGQRSIFERYYRERGIHGADIIYYGWHELVADWSSGKDLEVKSVIPETLNVGD